LNGERSPRPTNKALVTLIIAVISIAPALPITTTSNVSQQSSNNLNNPNKEDASTTATYWAKTYGGTSDDYAFSVQQTSDGGYIVAGETSSFGAGYSDVWVFKLSFTGLVEWQKTYGGTDDDVARSVQQTSDGGYIITGDTSSFGAGGILCDVWVLKLHSTGGVAWQQTYRGTNLDLSMAIQQTSDGGYIIAGHTGSFGAGDRDVWVLKLDSAGLVVWDEGSGASTQATSVVPSRSDATASATSVTATSSTAVVENATATPQDTNAVVTAQSSPGETTTNGRDGHEILPAIVLGGAALVVVAMVVFIAVVLVKEKKPTGTM
jgi:cell division septation protein DedD